MSRVEEPGTECTVLHPSPGCTLVRFSGELDACSAPQIETELKARVPADFQKLVVDLTDVEFIDSSGIRILLQLAAHRGAGAEKVVVYPRSQTARRALEIIGLEKAVRVVPSLDGVLEGESGMPAEEEASQDKVVRTA